MSDGGMQPPTAVGPKKKGNKKETCCERMGMNMLIIKVIMTNLPAHSFC